MAKTKTAKKPLKKRPLSLGLSTTTPRLVKISQCVATEDNPRAQMSRAALASLKQSIAAEGLLQPLIGRPHPTKRGAIEIRAGCRRLAACRALNFPTVPVVVAELDDAAAMVITIAENLEREDLHPLEEADGIRRLRETGLTGKQIAQRLARSEAWVTRRGQLANLTSELKQEMRRENGKWAAVGISVMERIARLPAESQARFVEHVNREGGWCLGDVESVDRFIADRFLRGLSLACWDLRDGSLIPEAGACDECQKRSDRVPLLFPELAESEGKPRRKFADIVCLDAECWQRKSDAALVARAAELLKKHPDAVAIIPDYPSASTKFASRFPCPVLGHTEYVAAAKSSPGTVRALEVSGPRMGKIRHVVLDKGQQPADAAPPRKSSPAPPAKTLRERRAALESRREAFIADEIRMDLERRLDAVEAYIDGRGDAPTAVEEHLPVVTSLLELLALVAVFTDADYASYAGPDVWSDVQRYIDQPWPTTVADKPGSVWGHAALLALGRRLLDLFAQRLVTYRTQKLKLGPEIACLARWLWPVPPAGMPSGLEELRLKAQETLPEPASWKKLETDEPPKRESKRAAKQGKTRKS